MKFNAVILCLCLGLTSCGLFQGTPEPVEVEEQTQPTYVGQITSIHAAQNFVIIRHSAGVTIPTGTILISRGPSDPDGLIPERVANLRVSGENRGLMAAADIQAGLPEVGDSVYLPLIGKPEESGGSPRENP